MKKINESYSNKECPDCGEHIKDNVVSGEECKNCGHVFYEEKYSNPTSNCTCRKWGCEDNCLCNCHRS